MKKSIKIKIGWLIEFFIVFLLASKSYAQIQQVWIQRYNGSGNGDDKAYAITIDAAGNSYITGESVGNSTGPDIITIKYNPQGVQQWVTIYNGPGDTTDVGRAIIVDNQGNVYVTGQSTGAGTGLDYVTIKYDAQGTQQWVNRYNGPGNRTDEAVSIALDNSGNIIVTGFSVGSNLANGYATIKYNPQGIQQWVERYNSPSIYDDQANCVKTDNFGNVYVTGSSYAVGSFYDYATIKYNSSGVEQWVSRFNGFGGHSEDFANAVAVDSDGNVYVTGRSTIGTSGYTYATVKYNTLGTELWVSRYNGPGGYGSAYSIALDNSGYIYVTGIALGLNNTELYATLKYSSQGLLQWASTFNGPGNILEFPPSAAVDNAGNVYITGKSADTNSDYNTIKYNFQGTQQWMASYNGPANSIDRPSSIAVDSAGSIYVTGYSTGIGTGEDITTIKYGQVTGVKRNPDGVPEKYSLSQNYPNPFNPSTKIKFDIPVNPGNELTSLKIYDILGHEVAALINGNLSPGTYEVEWNASNFPSGIYFYSLKSGSFSQTKRMTLVK